jgi:hypothetical protein
MPRHTPKNVATPSLKWGMCLPNTYFLFCFDVPNDAHGNFTLPFQPDLHPLETTRRT